MSMLQCRGGGSIDPGGSNNHKRSVRGSLVSTKPNAFAAYFNEKQAPRKTPVMQDVATGGRRGVQIDSMHYFPGGSVKESTRSAANNPPESTRFGRNFFRPSSPC
jgi:hypothetical protein